MKTITRGRPEGGLRSAFAAGLFTALFLLGAALLIGAPAAQAATQTGTYTGNGVDNRPITGLGFQPDGVIIKAATAQYAVMRTSTMAGDLTKAFVGGTALEANVIQSLDVDGFTLGTDARVNANGVAYHWIAFKAIAGEITFGSYTGDATDSRDIAGLGFQPDLVFLLPASTQNAAARFSSQTGDASFYFSAAAAFADGIQAFNADGFQVGTTVNAGATVYHYVAWKSVWGKRVIGSYTGNGVDNRNISGLGFDPRWVLIKNAGARAGVHKPDTTGIATDATQYFINTANFADGIQRLDADGFQVGRSATVNENGVAIHYAAFALNLTAQPAISSAANQIFVKGDAATAISPITVTDAAAPMITAGNDIRIRIPYWFNMTWDTSVTTAVIGGGAAGKVSTTVSYENAGKILVLNVTSDFASAETITVSGLKFANFTAKNYPDNLELEVLNDDAVTSTDDKTITILDPADAARDLPAPPANLETIPAGSLVIAMDNDKQNIGSLFNIRAYGLVNHLLWNEIPVKWAIRAGKAKDGIDFSATAQRLYPSALGPAALDFRGGPFIVHKYFVHDAKPLIQAFGGSVAVYELTADATVDIRYTIEHKPKIGVLDDGGNAGIHMAILASAGFVAGTHYEHILAASLETVNQNMCYTFISEPHYGETPPASDGPVRAIRNFVASGGNFLAQCAAIESYENNPTWGHFQTTAGITVQGVGDATHDFDNPDLAYSQFQGEVADAGGSVPDWALATGSNWQSTGHIHVKNNPSTSTFSATASKLTVGAGSLVFYLGGHEYDGTTLGDINAQRMYLNAALIPSARPTNCNPYFPTEMTPAVIYSATDQVFAVNQAATPISLITVLESNITTMTAGNDIRITIPNDLNMTWDTADLSALIGGPAAGKVSATVSYEDGGKTLVLNVTSDFAAGEYITVSGLSYANFTQPSYPQKLGLEIYNDGTVTTLDDKTIAIGGAPTPCVLAYGEGTVITPRYRYWDGAAFGTELTAQSADDVNKWTILKASPVANEMILGVYSSATKALYIQTLSGGTWTANWSTVLGYDGATRVFDIAYERSTGDAIVVFGDTDGKLYYRKRISGVWDSADQAIGGITLDNDADWVRAESHPTSDDIFVATSTEAASLYALRWYGAGNYWDNVLKTTAGVKNKDREGFDLAFERASGNAFLIWGDADADVNYREFTTVWQAEATAYADIGDDVYWLKAAYDPVATSNSIAIGMTLENTTFRFGAWNGSSWVAMPDATPIAARNRDQRGIDVAFEEGTGEALFAFATAAAPTQLSWRTWSSAGGFTAAAAATGATGNVNFVQLKPIPGSDDLMAVYSDANADLWYRYWDGSAFSLPSPAPGTALETTLSENDKTEAFCFACRAAYTPTAIDLLSFAAAGQNGTVLVSWRTAQEAGTLGFHLWRATGEGGPYARITATAIPALVSAVRGADYSYTDAGVTAGTRYWYKLEEIETTGKKTLYGPVAAEWAAAGSGIPLETAGDATTVTLGGGATEGGAGTLAGTPGTMAAPWSPPATARAYKVLVAEEGIYRLTGSWLASKGVDPAGLDLGQVRMYNLGEELAIHIYDPNANNRLDDGDFIQFYGKPVTGPAAKYAKSNVYWLTASGGTGAPKRMAAIEAAPAGAAAAVSHLYTLRHEEDGMYIPDAAGSDAEDRWFFEDALPGPGYGGGPVDFTVNAPGATGAAGTLKIRMYGIADMTHAVDVAVNGVPAGTVTWTGMAYHEAVIIGVPFLDGANTVTLTCTSGTVSEPDGAYVDRFEAIYPRRFEAAGSALRFAYAAGARYQVYGFADGDIQAFDVTEAAEAGRVVNAQITGAGPYTLGMEPQGATGDRVYLALSAAGAKTPLDILPDRASTLSSNGADYILITTRGLGWDAAGAPRPWLSSLLSLRQGQGLRAVAVDAEDIGDEFGYGLATPQAVRDFLAHAYANWARPAPRYALLVGDGTNDPKNNNQEPAEGSFAYLPAYLGFTAYMGETAKDDWFVRASGSGAAPDLHIGRLPASSVAQAEAMAAKIVAYEQAANTRTWERNVRLAADNKTADYEAMFEIMSDDAAALVPTPGMSAPEKLYLNSYGSAAALKAALKDRINAGSLIVNYSGHGWWQQWAEENVFSNADVAGLTNGAKLPFFVGMTCLSGYFLDPESYGWPSLGEVLMRAGGKGAVAALMPTGMTATDGQYILDKALFDALFRKDIRNLGPAIAAAKQDLLASAVPYREETAETFLLFGDPATRLKIPMPGIPQGIAAVVQNGAVTLSWQAALDCDGAPVSGYNVYRADAPDGEYTKLNGSRIEGTTYVDQPPSHDWYYAVTAVDVSGVESAAGPAHFINLSRTGDVNGDGRVDLADLIAVLRILAGMGNTVPEYVTSVADVNGDGVVGMAEAAYILQKLGGLR